MLRWDLDAITLLGSIHPTLSVAMGADRLQRAVRTGGAAYRFLLDLYVRQGTPILVYQMGRVGSTSIARTLRVSGVQRVIRLHRLNPEHASRLNLSKRIPIQLLHRRLVSARTQKLKIISPVRDPIARGVSAFFENLERYVPKGHGRSIHDLRKIFIEQFHHDAPSGWFDREIKQVFGVDVYEYPFDPEVGHLSIVTDDLEILVFKIELGDDEIECLLAEFLHLDRMKLIRANQGSTKVYAELYREFVQTQSLPEKLVTATYASKYARHFYSSQERSDARARWIHS